MCCIAGAIIIGQIIAAWQMITLRRILFVTSTATTIAFAIFATLNPIPVRADLQTIENVAYGRITIRSAYVELQLCGSSHNAGATLNYQRWIAGKPAVNI